MSLGLRGRTIALAGGAGFIGHSLALALVEQGARVHVLDSLQVNNLAWFASGAEGAGSRELYVRMLEERLELLRKAGVALHVQDLRDRDELSRALGRIRPETVVHLAAVAHTGRANQDPQGSFDHGLVTLENALEWSRRNPVERFVYLSSSMAYGDFLHGCAQEDHPLDPVGIYAALKVAGEKMVIAHQQVFGLPFTIVRPTALYGPRCVSRRVVQVFAESAIQGLPLRVEGDGGQQLDFTWIDDLVAGLCLALASPSARNQVFNLSYGSSRSVAELVDVVRSHFPGVRVESVERAPLVAERGALAIEKARRLLGYRPRYGLEEGFARYLDWYRAFGAASAPIRAAEARP